MDNTTRTGTEQIVLVKIWSKTIHRECNKVQWKILWCIDLVVNSVGIHTFVHFVYSSPLISPLWKHESMKNIPSTGSKQVVLIKGRVATMHKTCYKATWIILWHIDLVVNSVGIHTFVHFGGGPLCSVYLGSMNQWRISPVQVVNRLY
jgi:hypothetical protein